MLPWLGHVCVLFEPRRLHYSSITIRVDDIILISNGLPARKERLLGLREKCLVSSASLSSGISKSYSVPWVGTRIFLLSLQNFSCLCSVMRTDHMFGRALHMWAERVSYSLGMDPCLGHISQPGSSSQVPAPSAASDETELAFNATRKTVLLTKARFELLTQDFPTAHAASACPGCSDPRGFLRGHRTMKVCAQESPVPSEESQDQLQQLYLSTGAIYPGLSARVNFQFKRLRRTGLWGDLPKGLFSVTHSFRFLTRSLKAGRCQIWRIQNNIENGLKLGVVKVWVWAEFCNFSISAGWYLTKIIHR